MNVVLDHIFIVTKNLPNMVQFFEHSLGLKKGKRPPLNFRGAWMWNDHQPLIHLSERHPADQTQGTGVIDHIAFNGSDYDAFIGRLKQHHIQYFESLVPADNIQQVFVDGPEGLRIEVQFESSNSK